MLSFDTICIYQAVFNSNIEHRIFADMNMIHMIAYLPKHILHTITISVQTYIACHKYINVNLHSHTKF